MKLSLFPVSVIFVFTQTGCAFFPNNNFYSPPLQDAHSSWVRIIDNTEQTSIYQTLNGKRTGGLIRASEWVLQHTQDRGMPKVAGEKYNIDYYETPVVPGVETAIENVYVESKYTCLITTRFIPEKDKKYEFRLEADTLHYQCRAIASEIVQDSNGQWKRIPLQNVRYSAKEGSGWHPMHSDIGR
ncbi:hypothetical protein [Erwinia sp. V71]|uniref:hypothetical protein n=1 Tax=Erwinia sp. V71 TaxID=3369424 RepID=UPI003F5F0D85